MITIGVFCHNCESQHTYYTHHDIADYVGKCTECTDDICEDCGFVREGLHYSCAKELHERNEE